MISREFVLKNFNKKIVDNITKQGIFFDRNQQKRIKKNKKILVFFTG